MTQCKKWSWTEAVWEWGEYPSRDLQRLGGLSLFISSSRFNQNLTGSLGAAVWWSVAWDRVWFRVPPPESRHFSSNASSASDSLPTCTTKRFTSSKIIHEKLQHLRCQKCPFATKLSPFQSVLRTTLLGSNSKHDNSGEISTRLQCS